MLVGDASAYGQLPVVGAEPGRRCRAHPEDLILPARADGGQPAGLGVASLPESATICSCNNVDKGTICRAIADGAQAVPALKTCTKAGTGCGSCVTLLGDILKSELKKAGVAVNTAPVRALLALPPGAVQPGPAAQAQDLRGAARAPRAGAGLRDLQARGGVDPGVGVERAHPRAARIARCRTPTIASWPTFSATGPIRSCRACRRARSRRIS